MKGFMVYSLVLAILVLSGCVMRVIPREVDRVDQELEGNRGVIRGESVEAPAIERKSTKRIYDVEIEFFSPLDAEIPEEKAGSASGGNRGYFKRSNIPEAKSRPLKVKKERPSSVRLKKSVPQVIYQEPAVEDEKPSKASPSKVRKAQRVYVVEKGDTLQKISQKAYGTTTKWPAIYKANKDVLKSPDKISVGQRLVIPQD